MFERYNEKARRVVFFARYLAGERGSHTIESQHLLLGLFQEDGRLVQRFLDPPEAVEWFLKKIEAQSGSGKRFGTSVEVPLSAECKRILNFAAEEAGRMVHFHIGTEHLLLGILREENCLAARILAGCGMKAAAIREALVAGTAGAEESELDYTWVGRRVSRVSIYEELGVKAYINANEWYSSQGGSMLPAPVVAAMAEAQQGVVRLEELQNAVDEAIAKMTGNPAACVTSCATAGIVLAVAAFMSGCDAEKSERLPDTRGMKRDVIFQRADRFGEDAAIAIPGARRVEVGDKNGATEKQLKEAITAETAAVFMTPPREGMMAVEKVVRIAHGKGVGVIVDAAWAIPPKEHLWKFTGEYGADVVIVSGSKGLRGPQASGIVMGRKEVVEACRKMVAPHCRIGRPMKMGRETMVGIYAAVKYFLDGGAERTQEMARTIGAELSGIPGVKIEVDEAASHVHVKMSATRISATRDEIKERLMADEPRVLVRNDGTNGIRINAGMLAEGQERVVARRVREVLVGAKK